MANPYPRKRSSKSPGFKKLIRGVLPENNSGSTVASASNVATGSAFPGIGGCCSESAVEFTILVGTPTDPSVVWLGVIREVGKQTHLHYPGSLLLSDTAHQLFPCRRIPDAGLHPSCHFIQVSFG